MLAVRVGTRDSASKQVTLAFTTVDQHGDKVIVLAPAPGPLPGR